MVVLWSVPVAAEAWQPPEPGAGQDDWVKLVSGEWLRGTIEILRDTDFEFDSEKLDLQKMDWEDVAELRSSRTLAYRFDDAGTFLGTGAMRDSVVTIRTAEGVRQFPRSELLSILPGGKRKNLWSGKGSLGFVVRSGNTDQRDLNATADLRRQTTATRFVIKYLGNLGEVDGAQTINNHNVSTFIDILVAAGFYVTPTSLDHFRDTVNNIDYRNTIGAGVGYFILRGGDVDWQVGLDGGYRATSYVSVQEGEEDLTQAGSIGASTELDWEITGDIEIKVDYDVNVGIPETADTFHHAGTVLSVDLIGDVLELDFSLYWDRNANPKADAEGKLPKKDDFRSVVGVGIDF